MAYVLTRFHVFHRHILYFCYWCLQKLFYMSEMKKISYCNMAPFCLISWIFVMKILGWKHFKEMNYWQNYFTYWSMWGSMRSTKPWYLYLRFKIRQIRAWEKNFEIRSAKLGWGFQKCTLMRFSDLKETSTDITADSIFKKFR